nr:dsDNA nuclease domain-containing protein [Planococcus citreus]
MLKPGKTGDSIFGKLYILKYDSRKKEKDDIKISLVCNAPLNDGKKTFNDIEVVNMATIDSKAVNKIKEKMKNELKLTKEINLKNSHYEKTSMDLIYPEKNLIGEIVLFFEDTFKSEPKKANMLFKMLKGEIERKASFELTENNYESILEKKGVSRTYLDVFLHNYKDTADIAIEKAKKFVEDHYKDDFRVKLSLLRAISHMMSQLSRNNMQLTLLEEEIKNYFSEENIVNLPKKEVEIIEQICKEMIPDKPIEVSNSEIKALVIIVMKKLEEEVYEI